jgi:hypothetical protein
MIFVDRFWSTGINTQAEDRIHRVGQTSNGCLYIDLVLDHPIDHLVHDVLSRKEHYVNAIDQAAGVRTSLREILPNVQLSTTLMLASTVRYRKKPPARYSDLIKSFQDTQNKGLKHPTIRLQLENGDPVFLRMSWSGSEAGNVLATEGGWGTPLYGRVTSHGKPQRFKNSNQQVLDLLDRANENLGEVAKSHGDATGVCCFCGQALTNDESKDRGYGEVCATKWGLTYNRRRNQNNKVLGDLSVYDLVMAFFEGGVEGISKLQKHGKVSREALSEAIVAVKKSSDSDTGDLQRFLDSLPEG